ncbi:flagellar biosynthetic protein FliR [Ancylobacter radicis]|uniref:Flagellar type III secretion system protein FliR n=1 Tax=Ancylobacter radicis TaxID=2836179 RepID=A0ABS5REN6_9HYPH|nr:flagellar biosynthetic protein FliR [Ancylobacter radicis]MBS9479294.1 flagellar type III secretion system protein FliR [Ancylobacter radicis]
MMSQADALVVPGFLVFCRIGACFMLMPGFASARLPMKIRLFLALGVSLALLPLLEGAVVRSLAGAGLPDFLLAIAGELATGGIIGLLARIFVLALQAMATAAAQSIGLAMPAGIMVEDEQMPEITVLFSLSATVLIFVTGQHWEIIKALVDSYSRIPPAQAMNAGGVLTQAVDQLSATFLLALRLASPFMIYSVVVNFAVGLTNKLTPQIPVYFIAMPFVTLGGLLLLYAIADDMLAMFIAAFGVWLRGG